MVKRVFHRVKALYFDIATLHADQAFYNRAVIQQFREGASVMQPVIRHGKQMAEKLEPTISYWTEYTT
ncbi:hypothetical protein [Natronorarus salvus]|uniref:hypothetical protein n=1 Tax=Natronorarus salvus TaxID=3117733 RepID=UPI002F2655EB